MFWPGRFFVMREKTFLREISPFLNREIFSDFFLGGIRAGDALIGHSHAIVPNATLLIGRSAGVSQEFPIRMWRCVPPFVPIFAHGYRYTGYYWVATASLSVQL